MSPSSGGNAKRCYEGRSAGDLATSGSALALRDEELSFPPNAHGLLCGVLKTTIPSRGLGESAEQYAIWTLLVGQQFAEVEERGRMLHFQATQNFRISTTSS